MRLVDGVPLAIKGLSGLLGPLGPLGPPWSTWPHWTPWIARATRVLAEPKGILGELGDVDILLITRDNLQKRSNLQGQGGSGRSGKTNSGWLAPSFDTGIAGREPQVPQSITFIEYFSRL